MLKYTTIKALVADRALARFTCGWIVAIALSIAFVMLNPVIDQSPSVTWEGLLPSWPLILNATPGILLALVVIAVSGRALLSFVLAAGAYMMFYAVSALKQQHLGVPLLPQDLGVVSFSSVGLLANYMEWNWRHLAALVAGACLVGILLRWEPVSFESWLPARMSSLAAAIILTIGWWGQFETHYSMPRTEKLEFELWSPQRSVEMSGLINSFAYFTRVRAAAPAPDESPQATMSFLGNLYPFTQAVRPVGQQPDVILLQSEALFDPSLIGGVSRDHLYGPLEERGLYFTSGDLYVPAYGGGTIRTEFEALTGISLRSFPGISYPYLELEVGEIPSIVSSFAESGYHTFALHPNSPEFWRRGDVFRTFGFDVSVWKNDFSSAVSYVGPYPSDESLITEAISILESNTSAPTFLFAISIQNHGPYLWHSSLDDGLFDNIDVPAGLSADAKRELQTYLYHLRSGAEQFGRLVEFLVSRERPSVLFVYGDHLPALPNAFSEIALEGGVSEYDAPSKWFCVSVHAIGCPADGISKASWQIPALIERTTGVGSDAFFSMKGFLPTQLAELSQAPQAGPPKDPPDWLASLEEQARSVDVARVSGTYGERKAQFRASPLRSEFLADDLPILASPPIFGRYVSDEHRVVGLTSEFSRGERIFAFVDVSGTVADAAVSVRLRDGTGEIVRNVTPSIGPWQWRQRVNVDFGTADFQAGEYIAEVVVENAVVSTSKVSMGVQGNLPKD